ncbi:hypothetical protein [Hymenobacter properus]|uniref:Uncharacterized protein n=1 Tax=Hymenobacter properus TaxID=2791026 RepID=A0A931BGX0_9BACT|nr:hypothetical protein [Hymenobacter properus]MBF9139998.1 hypothetical protein [Hymenobacter properus]MBR7718805.1 hypothetical protein [Microvirga sp. SRT04]
MGKLETLLLIFLGLGALVAWWWYKARVTAARERQERPPRPAGDGPALSDDAFYTKVLLMQAQNAATPQESRPAVVPDAPIPTWWHQPWGGLWRRKVRRP